MEHNTAKHFVLQLGSLISLYLSLSFLLVLLFGLINLRFPDPAALYYEVESAASGVRIGIAMVVVFFPTYLVLTRMVNTLRRKETSGTYLTLTKWLIYLSLLIGGGVLLGDLVAVIMTFLEGDLTTRFICKALAVLVVVGTAFYYYLLDARTYWVTNEQKSIVFAIAASIVVCITLAFGFSYIETPAQVRERNLDEKQLSDLQEIQMRIESYIALNNETPASLSNLEGSTLPTAPEGRAAYEYTRTDRGFTLCATFATESVTSDMYTAPFDEKALIGNAWNWDHSTGRQCFERVVQTRANTTSNP